MDAATFDMVAWDNIESVLKVTSKTFKTWHTKTRVRLPRSGILDKQVGKGRGLQVHELQEVE